MLSKHIESLQFVWQKRNRHLTTVPRYYCFGGSIKTWRLTSRKHKKRPLRTKKKNICNIGQKSLIRSTKQLFVEKNTLFEITAHMEREFFVSQPEALLKDRRSFRISYSISETLMIIKNFKMTYLYNSLFGKKPYRSGSHKNLQIACINSVQKKWNSLQRLEICWCVLRDILMQRYSVPEKDRTSKVVCSALIIAWGS